jgi:hypothetical protein
MILKKDFGLKHLDKRSGAKILLKEVTDAHRLGVAKSVTDELWASKRNQNIPNLIMKLGAYICMIKNFVIKFALYCHPGVASWKSATLITLTSSKAA